jgi:hypothetical protein
LDDLVVFISAFMALILSLKCERRRTKAPPRAAYSRARVQKSSKSGLLLEGKIIPARLPAACETSGTAQHRSSFHPQNQTEERVMYIGLGGILVLILILWLLGVI